MLSLRVNKTRIVLIYKFLMAKANFSIKKVLLFLLFTLCFTAGDMVAQTVPSSSILSADVEDLTDEQIQSYWERAKQQGYTMEQQGVFLPQKLLNWSVG